MSSSDNDQKKAEEMSLSELLGGATASDASASPSAPTGEPVDDGSGLINLAQMVQAAVQPPPVEQPRPTSPSYPGAPVPGGMPPAAQSGGFPAAQTGGYPAAPGAYDQSAFADLTPPRKKNMLPVIIIAAVVVIAGAVGAFVAMSGGEKEDSDAKLAKLEADLAAALAKAEAEGDENKKAELEAQIAAQQGNAAPQAGAENDPGAEDEYEITEEEVDDGKGGKTKRRVRRAKKSSSSSSSTVSASSSSGTSSSTAKESAPTTSSSGSSAKPATKTSELDSLLAGSSSAASSGGGGLPEKPSRAQVQSAMGKVVSQAKTVCGKSGSGNVSVRIIVGSNGVVRDAIPTGAHSADSLGRCVATIARRTTRLPKFKSPTFTFTYPFNI